MEEVVWQASWEGEIGIVFTLDNGDPNNPYFSYIPRHSYFTLHTEALRKFFAISTPKEDMWFASNGVPLRWNLSVGTLYDIYGGSTLPWPITVYTTDFPSDMLLRCPEEATVRSHFFNTLKQAHFLKFGEVDKINDLTEQESNELWAGIVRNDKSKFIPIEKQISQNTKIPRAPVRLLEGGATGQKLMKQVAHDTTETSTLAELLQSVLPESIDCTNPEFPQIAPNWKISIQGILPPLLTPLSWLIVNLCSVDNFLYIVYFRSE